MRWRLSCRSRVPRVIRKMRVRRMPFRGYRVRSIAPCKPSWIGCGGGTLTDQSVALLTKGLALWFGLDYERYAGHSLREQRTITRATSPRTCCASTYAMRNCWRITPATDGFRPRPAAGLKDLRHRRAKLPL